MLKREENDLSRKYIYIPGYGTLICTFCLFGEEELDEGGGGEEGFSSTPSLPGDSPSLPGDSDILSTFLLRLNKD